MKVYIGPFPKTWIHTSKIENKWLSWNHKKSHYDVDEAEYTKWDKRVIKICDWIHDKMCMPINNHILSKRKRKVKIKLHDYDVWNGDDTLAMIILPLLKKTREDKQGCPIIDNEDLPEHMHIPGDYDDKNTNDYDTKLEEAWDYVLGEMIYAFESGLDNNWEDQFVSGETDWISIEDTHPTYGKVYRYEEGPNHTYKVDRDAMKIANDRRDNGRRLFAKYFHNLWT
jgi:hypothetical protein